jgi:type II secretory pathway predicted ATPase ExeA
VPHTGSSVVAKNPYRPGVGLQPTHLAGRDGQIRRFSAALGSAPEIPANLRLTGLRGVGKTVLLSRFDAAATDAGWATLALEMEPRHNSDEQFINLLSGHLRRLQATLSTMRRLKDAAGAVASAARRTATVTYEGFEWSLSGEFQTHAVALAELLEDTVSAATRAGRTGLALLFDEAQIISDDKPRDGDHPLSLLLAAVSLLQRRGLPIALVLCGLPTLTINLLAARTYSERMFRGDEVASLPSDEAKLALTIPLQGTGRTATDDLLDRVVETVEGYPYFIQLWGAELWDAASYQGADVLDLGILGSIHEDIYRRLDFDFYAPRLDSLTPAEQDLLVDASRCSYPPLLAGQLGERSAKTPGNVNVLLGRLVKANVLYRQGKGRYFYTAPGFDDYLKRRAAREH